jgi:hypothetical protein
MQCLARRGTNFAIISRDTPAELIRGLLDRYEAAFPVIGPQELRQVGFEGLTWQTLASIAGADPSTSRFITRQKIEDWPIVFPEYALVWKSFQAFRHTYKYTGLEKRYISRNPDASKKAHRRVVKVTGQDFGSDFRAWRKWLVAQERWHWITMLRNEDGN